ncbi:FAD-binding oxidoreductase [Pseudodonghicola flavimaris]|uniref:FAD-binding oxidoreductase n=1 Tax=Pseudodonghicola flavimaris TaxID=3050036 RepID=A0ABT7EXJ4_9RHOB|nr:FAD-binding oxidoreductase [Pseudodonghicola flavimaris]MDK3017059.1 FAD-binding oxidoreductase [Pseudodonghicola flavimaris]
MTQDFAQRLLDSLGSDLVTLGADIPPRHCHDWAGLAPVSPLALVRPRRTEDVSALMRLCHAAGVPVVPQGGLSGISGAAHPRADAVALSLDRMNRIERLDPQAAQMVAEAGVVLEVAQTAARDAGMMLGIDIGARGSCQLGGVIATNAGGNTVIRYGMAREHVLGLEAVLADGTVISDMAGLIKNNAGMDVKQLFIGTEGLLGVVTRCILRLQPEPRAIETALCAVADTDGALALLAHLRAALGPQLSSFEVMWPSFYNIMASGAGLALPLPAGGPHVLVEATGFSDTALRAGIEEALGEALEQGIVGDAILAKSAQEGRGLWAVRESVSEYPVILGPLVPFDVSIPLRRMSATVALIETGIADRWPGARALTYGHIGDNNLHLVVALPEPEDHAAEKALKAFVYDAIRAAGGTVSAEHGIGAIKRDYLAHSRTPEEIALMRAIKRTMDPGDILNRGKSFDP